MTPPRLPVGAARWLLEVHVDRRWYELRRSPEPIPAPGRPRTIALDGDDAAGTGAEHGLLLGRGRPGVPVDLDLRPDNGVSRRHALLQHGQGHWRVLDLGSHNGTWVSPDEMGLPQKRIGARTRLLDASSIYLGGWTRLVLRRVGGGGTSQSK